MSSPLQGEIAEDVSDALSELLYDVTLIRETSNYDVSTGRSNQSTETYTGKGFVDEYEQKLIAEGVVQENDRKILLLQETFTDADGNMVKPFPGDSIEARGETLEVINVQQDPAQATWTVQGRG